MSEQVPVEMLLRLGSEDGDREEVDRLTRQLLGELKDQQVESVRLVPEATTPRGAKAAEAASIGMITLAVAPQLIPFVIDFLRNWRERQRTRRVRLTGTLNGHAVDFSGSEGDLGLLVRTLTVPESPDPRSRPAEPAPPAALD